MSLVCEIILVVCFVWITVLKTIETCVMCGGDDVPEMSESVKHMYI